MSKTKPLADSLRNEIRRAERRGITQYRIAKESGVSAGQLSRLMHGKVVPRLDTAERIARAIGCEIRLIPSKSS